LRWGHETSQLIGKIIIWLDGAKSDTTPGRQRDFGARLTDCAASENLLTISSHSELVRRDRDVLISYLREIVSSGTPYALLDYPNHSNVGDSAIWLGEVAALTEITGRPPAYNCTLKNFDAGELAAAIPKGGVVFLHGGGNFGDVWPSHQRFRERIIQECKAYNLIQLPQSISFNSVDDAKRVGAIISDHPSFQMLVRDRKSLEFSLEHLTKFVRLSPDGALGMGELKRNAAIRATVATLFRTDHEKSALDYKQILSTFGAPAVDWLAEHRGFNKVTKVEATVRALLSGAWTKQGMRFALYLLRARRRLDRGMAILSAGERVVTDRLHAHILSTMAGIPNVVFDNNNGKIHAYIATFTGEWSGVDVVDNEAAAMEQLSKPLT
jgi:pyruvyl transferase EpsO